MATHVNRFFPSRLSVTNFAHDIVAGQKYILDQH